MQNNLTAVIVEDTVADIFTASRVLNQAGIETVLTCNNMPRAMMYLEQVVAGEQTCPDLMVLDLGLGTDSGFEALRFRKSHGKLSACKVVVWTINGERLEGICTLLGASHVVAKADGEAALLKAVTATAAPSARTEASAD
jgi:CheY-like chemotaxis protein